jgi:hypothetical protein
MTDTTKRDAVVLSDESLARLETVASAIVFREFDDEMAIIPFLAKQVRLLRKENAALRAAVERVRALHAGRVVSSGLRRVCWECEAPFPCPTLRALDGDV